MQRYSIKGLLLELLLLQSMLSLGEYQALLATVWQSILIDSFSIPVSSQNSRDAVKLGVSDKDLTIVYEKSETFDVELEWVCSLV